MATSIFDIPRATVGDRVQHEFLVVDREEKKQANGDPFVLFTLGNSSGRLAGTQQRIIKDSGHWYARLIRAVHGAEDGASEEQGTP